MEKIWPTDFAVLLHSYCLELVPILESKWQYCKQIVICLSQTGFSAAEEKEPEHYNSSGQCLLKKCMQEHFVSKKSIKGKKKRERKPN